MDSQRRAELLASLSPEGRATYEILRAQLARDLDRSFAESKARTATAFGDLHTNLDKFASQIDAVKQDLRSNIADLRGNCRVNGERAKEIMAATAPTTPAARQASTTSWGAASMLAATAVDISTPATVSAPSAHTATSTCVPIVAVLDSTPPRVQAVTATAPTAAARVDLNLKHGIDHLVGSSAAPASNPSDVITPATATSAVIATSPRSTSSTASWAAASVGVATASASSTMSPAAEALLMRTMGSQNLASSIPVPVVTMSASHDSDLALATPTMCSTECPGEENSATRATPTHIGALLASPTSAQKMNTYSLWHAIAVSEFSSSQVHHLLRCELPKFVTALVCLPLLPWDVKYMWLSPDPLYGLKSKSRLLEHDMRDCFLFVKRDNSHIIHVHASIDEDALFIIGNHRAQQSLCQWRVSQPQGRLQEGDISRAEAVVSSGMFITRRNFQLALLYAVVWYCSGASDSLPVAIALDRSEQFSLIIAWLTRAFPDCSRIIADKLCNVMAVPVFRLGISVQSLSCFAAARYAPIQWEIAWLMGPLQDNISSCFKTYSSSCGFELQQWRIAWSFSDALLQHELLSCTCGAVSFSVSEKVQWKIACSLCYDFSVLDNISMRFLCECSAAMNWCKIFQNHVEFSGNTNLQIMVPCSSLEMKFLLCTAGEAPTSSSQVSQWILAWYFSVSAVLEDTACSDFGAVNSSMDLLLFCGVELLVYNSEIFHWIMAWFLKFGQPADTCTLRQPFPEPTTVCHNVCSGWFFEDKYLYSSSAIAPPLCFVGDEATKLQHLGTCHEKQYNGLTLQYSSGKKTMYGSESFPWYIAWLLVTSSCACTDYRGRTPMNMSTAANSEMEGGTRGAEALTFLRMFLYGRKFQLATLSAVVLYSNGGSNSLSAGIALHGSEHFTWTIAWLHCCSCAWYCQCWVVFVHSKGRIGIHSEESWSPLHADQCTGLSPSCAAEAHWRLLYFSVMDDLFLAVGHFDGVNMFRQQHSEAMLRVHSNCFELVIDGFLQAWYLSCLSGHIIQGAYDRMQWKISWLLAVICRLVIEIGGSLHVSRVELMPCYVHPDETCSFQFLQLNRETPFGWVQSAAQVPWDPGGSAWIRLEGKPNVMKGGLLATSPVLGWIMSRYWALGLSWSYQRYPLHIHRGRP